MNAFRAGGLGSLILGLLLVGTLLAFGVTREVPIGGIAGTVTMPGPDRPLPGAEVVLYSTFPLPEGARSTWSTRTDERGRFALTGLPAGQYRASVFAKAHSVSDLPVAILEGSRAEVTLPTKRSQPDLEVYGNERVYLPRETPTITARGLSDAKSISVSIRRVSDAEIEKRGDVAGLLGDIVSNRIPKDVPQTRWVKEVAFVDHAINRRDIEGQFVEEIPLANAGEGVFLCRVTAGKEVRFSWFIVSRIALVTKAENDRLLAYVTDLETGVPVAGAEVAQHGAGGSRRLGTTGADGTLEAARARADGMTVVAAKAKGSQAYSWFYAGSGGQQGRTMVWVQSDRPAYRPGDTVKFKGVLRDPDPTGYRLPAAGQATLEVTDPDGETLQTSTMDVSEVGTVSGEFTVDRTALPGTYTVVVRAGESSGSLSIPVLAYRKPEFRVTVTPESRFFVRGETARFRVKAEYFTGEPLVGASVRAEVSRAVLWNPWGPDDDVWEDAEGATDFSDYGEYVTAIEAETDALGEAIVLVPTARGGDAAFETSDMAYSVTAAVSDQSGRQFDGRGQAIVGRGDIDLRASFDAYVASPGETVPLTVTANDSRRGVPAAGVEVVVEYGRERWSSGKSAFIPEGRAAVRTRPDGTATLELKAQEAGDFVARCTTVDSGGRRIGAQASLWAYDGQAEFGGRTPSLQIVLDKKSYAPTEKALALIRTDRPGGSALVTVETDRVVWRRVVPLTGRVTEIQIDDLSDYAPNVIVGVAYVRGKQFSQAERTLRVDLERRSLAVELVPDKTVLAPGETVTYTVKTTEPSGQPVSADVAVGVVDEGVYSIAEDRTDPLRAFYPRRWSSVTTSYSFPEIYLDGEEKTPGEVPLRSRFEDTAFWQPSVRTGPDGTAKVEVRLPDNLTEWRATATAFTTDTRIGRARVGVVAKRDLMARLSLPPFMAVGDRQAVNARISNTTDRPLAVRVSLGSEGIGLQGEGERSVTVGPRGSVDVGWTLLAEAVGTAKLRLTAVSSEGPSDGLELSFPVLLRGRERVASFASEGPEGATYTFERLQSAVDGELVVNLAPTLVARLLEDLPGLIDYPYGCVEQTLSRFVPALAVQRLADRTGLEVPGLREKMPEVTKSGLARLRAAQRPDGGWGWWEFGEPSPAMTGYAIEGLVRARENGVAVRPAMLERALDWAEQWLTKAQASRIDPKAWDAFDRVELAYAVLLVRPSKPAVAALDSLPAVNGLPTRAVAYALMARQRQVQQGLGGQAARDGLLQELLRRADDTPSVTSWPGDYGNEETALGLQALQAVQPESDLVPKVLRGLMGVRARGRWVNTRETARVVLAVADYLAASGELRPDMTVTVRIDGQPDRTFEFRGEGALRSPEPVRIPLRDLPAGEFTVRATIEGRGVLYSTATLRQSVAEDAPAAESSAPWLQVRREYVASSPTRMEDGTVRRVGGNAPISVATSGQVFRVRLTLRSDRPVTYLLLEDPIPSHCRIVGADTPSDGVSWFDWWSRSVFLDDKAAFFIESLPPGKDHVIEYPLRAEATGVCAAMPAVVSKMYQPDVRSGTGQTVLEVRAR